VPVAWVTRQAVPGAGRVWAALSYARQETGLVPFLLGGLPGEPARPWDTEEFIIRSPEVLAMSDQPVLDWPMIRHC